jgi:hypothetical protein
MSRIYLNCKCGNKIVKDTCTGFTCSECGREYVSMYDKDEHMCIWDLKENINDRGQITDKERAS